MIEIRDLAFRSIRIGHLLIPDGTTALIGANGSGKTTLLRLLAGLTPPDTGSITVDGMLPEPGCAGFVNEYPDRNALFSRFADELAAPLRFRHIPCEELEQRVKEAAATAGLERQLERTMDTLSGGEKVLAALLSALISSPETLILDEFDSHLDYDSLVLAENLISSSGARRVIRCTQNMDLAAQYGRVIVLHRGRVLRAGSPEEVFPALEETCCYPFSWRAFR
ncbi:MAG: energy-coupling factor ABC transporter ATP-binding protein [Methanomicrobiales archaeon]|nr:energy-coupling factor ABC transporter ATP-binding protein [Methanomicrobiales archaeon]